MQALSSLSIFPLSSLARHKYYDTPGKQLLLNFIQNNGTSRIFSVSRLSASKVASAMVPI